MSRFKRATLILAVLIVLPLIVYAANVLAGMRAAAQTDGMLHVTGLTAPVQIVRDARDIAHISAQNDHDLYFAQGYAEASDRMFQMDLVRRFVTGRLAEVLGAPALPADQHARIAPIAQIVRNEWTHLPASYRENLQAFSDGVNAAMASQPLAPEFRLLLYKPEPWTPQDSLAAGFSTALDLIDDWDDVVRRDDVLRRLGPQMQRDLYSITDPAYDAPVTGAGIVPVPRLHSRKAPAAVSYAQAGVFPEEPQTRFASNEFALGGARTQNGHALLANDPHLRLGIPGVWYLLELHSPGLHVAGVTLPGVPGVVLGHNEHIAWGATNGTVVTEVLYRDGSTAVSTRSETFHVRFGRDVRRSYYTTKHGFLIDKAAGIAVDWNAVRFPQSPLPAFAALNRARTYGDAIRALRSYPGPPQNFVIACDNGTAGYHLAGQIPDDPSWGLRVHRASDPFYAFVPFDALPHVDPSRSARVFTANARMYGQSYAYRLSSNFAAPYRAYRARALLDARPKHSALSAFAIQSDTLSLPERDLARALLGALDRKGLANDAAIAPYAKALRGWDGRFEPASRAATLMYAFRRLAIARLAEYNAGAAYPAYKLSAQNADIILLMRVLRERPAGWWPHSDYDAFLISTLRDLIKRDGEALLTPWQTAGAVTVRHPLASLGITFLNGGVLPGDGDAFSLHVLTNSPHSQSFRAVWDTGNWDGGGIAIPSGESGEPGSGHYTDLRARWDAQVLVPLPFSARAVAASERARLTLTP